MTESDFIKTNRAKWQELESLLEQSDRDPDRLQELFVQVSSDLAFAQTYYTNRTVRLYLNQLTQRVLDLLDSNPQINFWENIREFFQHKLPAEICRSRYAFLTSLFIFLVAVLIGVVSTAHDIDFAKVVLGEEYVTMTDDNINDGDPMAVYKSMEEGDMFFLITMNNIKVAFLAFVAGIFGSIGTSVILLSNGIMLGTFQYFFYHKGLFLTSFLTIWIHGTLEISAIIIAGAAGLVLGDGLLNPKTYDRTLSMQVASKRAVRILLGTVPLFVVAGFLESFVTRLTDLPVIVKIGIISVSLLLIIYQFIIHPYLYKQRNVKEDSDFSIEPQHAEQAQFKLNTYRTPGAVIHLTLRFLKNYFREWFLKLVLPSLVFFSCSCYVLSKYWELSGLDGDFYYSSYLFSSETSGTVFFLVYWTTITHICSGIILLLRGKLLIWTNLFLAWKNYGIIVALAIMLPLSIPYFLNTFWLFFFILIIPIQYLIQLIWHGSDSFSSARSAFLKYPDSFKKWSIYLRALAMSFFLYIILQALASSQIVNLISEWVNMHSAIIPNMNTSLFFGSIVSLLVIFFVISFLLTAYIIQYNTLQCQLKSTDLLENIENWNGPDQQLLSA
ncbi:MAG: putative membrane protein SpoIIM required for sporulation [Saprospiraceae bacterium]|jgi:uncharacterized membrane protein SpoIIM required for sporulation